MVSPFFVLFAMICSYRKSKDHTVPFQLVAGPDQQLPNPALSSLSASLCPLYTSNASMLKKLDVTANFCGGATLDSSIDNVISIFLQFHLPSAYSEGDVSLQF